MTRDEAISIMKVIVHMLEEKYDTDRVEEALDMAIKALELEPKTEWIPVSERLPGFGQTVLVTSDGDLYFEENGEGWEGKATTIAYLTEKGWEMSDINYDCQLNKITAWMPFPDPYGK